MSNQITIYNKHFNNYKKHHKNNYNVLVHLLCIPSIVWSTFGIVNKLDTKYKTPSITLYLLYMLYYYYFAPTKIFWKTFFFYLYILVHSNYHSYHLKKYIFIKSTGWFLQILSHMYIEKNKPAFYNDLFGSFITAPIFVVQEISDFIKETYF